MPAARASVRAHEPEPRARKIAPRRTGRSTGGTPSTRGARSTARYAYGEPRSKYSSGITERVSSYQAHVLQTRQGRPIVLANAASRRPLAAARVPPRSQGHLGDGGRLAALHRHDVVAAAPVGARRDHAPGRPRPGGRPPRPPAGGAGGGGGGPPAPRRGGAGPGGGGHDARLERLARRGSAGD